VPALRALAVGQMGRVRLLPRAWAARVRVRAAPAVGRSGPSWVKLAQATFPF